MGLLDCTIEGLEKYGGLVVTLVTASFIEFEYEGRRWRLRLSDWPVYEHGRTYDRTARLLVKAAEEIE